MLWRMEDGAMSKAEDDRDSPARRLLEDLERARQFRRHEMAVEREEGRKEGYRLGREEGLVEAREGGIATVLHKVARNLLGTGRSPAEVARPVAGGGQRTGGFARPGPAVESRPRAARPTADVEW